MRWHFRRSGRDVRTAVAQLSRFIVSPRTAKHRLFVWLDHETIPDSGLVVIAREDDYTFGILHSHIHEIWSRAMGTQLRDASSGSRYTPTTTLETFPFPHPTPEQRQAISDAARQLNQLRENWRDADPGRTLTNLYNANPTWLTNAHAQLDAAVANAYNWPSNLPDHQILQNLLTLNLHRHTQE